MNGGGPGAAAYRLTRPGYDVVHPAIDVSRVASGAARGRTLIIVVAPNDVQIIQIAQQQGNDPAGVFGNDIVAGGGPIPALAANENLFFIGHGIAGGGGNAEIGDANGAFAVDGLELWDNFSAIFPGGYGGDVYIDACYSANYPAGMFSLIETFKANADLVLNHTFVFGRTGQVAGLMPPPGDPTWVQA